MKTLTQKKTLTFIVALLLLVGALPVVAEAKSVIRSGENVSLAEEQVVEGDFYVLGDKVNISGSVTEDLLMVGTQATINGSVGGDAFVVSGSVNVHSEVADDLRIISGETTIASNITGDVLVMGATVSILSTASISGDLIVFASDVTVEGAVGGDILGAAGQIRIDAPVAGNVNVTTEGLTLGDRAVVDGDVRYVSGQLLVKSINATVIGDTVRSDSVVSEDVSFLSAFIPLLIMLFSLLVWYLVSRRTLNLVVTKAVSRSYSPFLLGALFTLVAPVAFGVLAMSVVGTMVGIVGLLGYLLILILSIVAGAAVIGHMVMVAFNRPVAKVSLASLVVGILGFGLLAMLPVIGFFILLLSVLVSVGAIIELIFKSK